MSLGSYSHALLFVVIGIFDISDIFKSIAFKNLC